MSAVPLPEPKPHIIANFGRVQYTADDMRAYGDAVRADERRRWEDALSQTWNMIDPFNPAGQPGSYARGQDSGIVAALTTMRQNIDAAIRASAKGDQS